MTVGFTLFALVLITVIFHISSTRQIRKESIANNTQSLERMENELSSQVHKLSVKMQTIYTEKSQELLDSYGFTNIKATNLIDNYNFEERKLIEIVKSTHFNPKVLVVDETTTALGHEGRAELFKVMKRINDIPDAISHSIAYASKDRDNESLVINDTIKDNICLPSLEDLKKNKILRNKDMTAFAEKYAAQMSTKMEGVNQFVSALSGGNKQKVVLARCSGLVMMGLTSQMQQLLLGIIFLIEVAVFSDRKTGMIVK